MELFCSGGFLREAVKAATVWTFISPEKGGGIEGEGRRETTSGGGGVPMEGSDTDSLVNRHPI